jgi:MFS family permease
MHGLEDFDGPKSPRDLDARPWYSEMTRYHWFVLFIAALGWLFDCLDQQLFTLARPIAIPKLLNVDPSAPAVSQWSGYTTTIFILGWATGGLIFGALGDMIGRAKTMIITILLYSACTGLSAFSVTVYDFALYRFLTGLGVGGEFAVGVALVAEVMPPSARARSLSLLQALSALGNITAAVIGLVLAPLERQGVESWRIMFVIGALPALLAVVIRRSLKEPEQWQKIAKQGAAKIKRGSYVEMFSDPRWRHHAIIGLLLAVPGVVGLWGILFFSGDLSRHVFREGFVPEIIAEMKQQSPNDALRVQTLAMLEEWELGTVAKSEIAKLEPNLTTAQKEIRKEFRDNLSSELTWWQSWTMMLTQVGAFLGMYSFGWLAQRIGRKPTFLLAYVSAMLTTAMVFWYLKHPLDVFWMMPVAGFCQLSLFAGYAIYFPELFPTHLRSTGTSFCYNVGRFVAASGPTLLGLLTSVVYAPAQFPPPENWRYAGVTMCAIYLVGMVTLPFAPETKDKPLPE